MAVGRIDVDEMLSEMTPQEFDGWAAYELLEPFGTKQQVKMLGQLLRVQVTEEIDDEDLAEIMGYTDPVEPVGNTDAAVMSAFGVSG